MHIRVACKSDDGNQALGVVHDNRSSGQTSLDTSAGLFHLTLEGDTVAQVTRLLEDPSDALVNVSSSCTTSPTGNFRVSLNGTLPDGAQGVFNFLNEVPLNTFEERGFSNIHGRFIPGISEVEYRTWDGSVSVSLPSVTNSDFTAMRVDDQFCLVAFNSTLNSAVTDCRDAQFNGVPLAGPNLPVVIPIEEIPGSSSDSGIGGDLLAVVGAAGLAAFLVNRGVISGNGSEGGIGSLSILGLLLFTLISLGRRFK